MIRFRIGQSWKREPSAPPVDAFGLDLDGVDLLAGASEESLAKVVPDLVEALHALAQGAPCAQLSLAEAHLEVALHRRGTEVDLRVVSLARPAQLTRPVVRVELAELMQATVRCARALAKDLTEAAPALLRNARHRRMLRGLEALERPTRPSTQPEATGWSYRLQPQAPLALGFELTDPEDLLLGFEPKRPFPLPSLLCGGAVWLALAGEGQWRAAGPPFLLALELSRAGGELVHALESSEASFPISLGAVAPPLQLDLARSMLTLQGAEHPVDAAGLARALLELGVAVAFAITTRNPAQAKNPYLVELNTRCLETLSHLRGALASPAEAGAASKRKRRAGIAAKPLRTAGKLRRLRFERLWEKANLGGEEPGRLLLGKAGPIFSSAQMAIAFSDEGAMLFRRLATHGVATSLDGRVITASADRVCLYLGDGASARWLRDHDGVALGPELEPGEGLLVATFGQRGALAFDQHTGREIWRVDPPRTQRGFLTLQGHRALLATDSGYLYGLDLADGQVRFRMRAALPFAGAAVPWGKKLVAVLTRADRSAIFAADAHSGAISWTRELPVGAPSQPLALGTRVYLAGEVDGQGTLVCLSGKGSTLWERRLPLGAGPFGVLPVGRTMVVTDASGAAVCVGPDSQIEWRLGAAGEELNGPLAPSLVRGVLLLAGETVRAVDPRGGRVLGEVRAGPGLCDLKVDPRLNLYLLDDAGSLKAYRLSSHFAVV